MALLFPTKVNARKNETSLEDFQPLRKREKIVADLRYLGENKFQLATALVRSLEVNQGWTCSLDDESGKVYLVRVENNADIAARFCVKTENKKTVSSQFKAEILTKALGDRVNEKFFTLVKLEEQPIEGIVLFEIVGISSDVDVIEDEVLEVEEDEVVLTDEPEKVEEAKVLPNPFSSEFATINAEQEEFSQLL